MTQLTSVILGNASGGIDGRVKTGFQKKSVMRLFLLTAGLCKLIASLLNAEKAKTKCRRKKDSEIVRCAPFPDNCGSENANYAQMLSGRLPMTNESYCHRSVNEIT
jgi:hypothetical protein